MKLNELKIEFDKYQYEFLNAVWVWMCPYLRSHNMDTNKDVRRYELAYDALICSIQLRSNHKLNIYEVVQEYA